ncbi:CrcB family protein [Methylocella silvestris]|uniref:CrcB family protein n=1 Tax=Methylocella silvestris TaxID=199596 RepID=UPI0011AFC49E|nr:CrcB family protein [Methylocella silvestris]
MITSYLWVGLGSALGGMSRFWFASFVTGLTGPAFPLGTLLINISGSFIIGMFAYLTGDG